MTTIDEMIGKTFVNVHDRGDELLFFEQDGSGYRFFHGQDCCEQVSIESIVGDLSDLIGSPLLRAEESTSDELFEGKPECPESFTWTFYKFATVKGWVDVRWLGESNGYYSESVDIERIEATK